MEKGILERLITADIEKDPIHFGTFTEEDMERFRKEYEKPKKKSLFDL